MGRFGGGWLPPLYCGQSHCSVSCSGMRYRVKRTDLQLASGGHADLLPNVESLDIDDLGGGTEPPKPKS